MSLGINDVLPFGKYKGRPVHEVVLDDPNWCCWIREEKKKAGQPKMWSVEVNNILDVAIDNDKKLKRYPKWSDKSVDLSSIMKASVEVRTELDEKQAQAENARRLAYEESWGAW